MSAKSPTEWYEYQLAGDAAARYASNEVLGPELHAFTFAMASLANCLDYAVAGGQEELDEKYKIAIAVHGFNHLCSAWDDTLTGRFDSAMSHGRIISESHDFLVALAGRPGLAADIESGKVKVEAALRATRDSLNEQRAGTGSDWFAERTSTRNPMHDFAHVTKYSVKSGWATRLEEGKFHAYLRPGGVTTTKTLRNTALIIAGTANVFLWAVVYAFQNNDGVRSFWQSEGEAKFNAQLEQLSQQLTQTKDEGGALDELTVQSSWSREDKNQDEVRR